MFVNEKSDGEPREEQPVAYLFLFPIEPTVMLFGTDYMACVVIPQIGEPVPFQTFGSVFIKLIGQPKSFGDSLRTIIDGQ